MFRSLGLRVLELRVVVGGLTLNMHIQSNCLLSNIKPSGATQPTFGSRLLSKSSSRQRQRLRWDCRAASEVQPAAPRKPSTTFPETDPGKAARLESTP